MRLFRGVSEHGRPNLPFVIREMILKRAMTRLYTSVLQVDEQKW